MWSPETLQTASFPKSYVGLNRVLVYQIHSVVSGGKGDMQIVFSISLNEISLTDHAVLLFQFRITIYRLFKTLTQ